MFNGREQYNIKCLDLLKKCFSTAMEISGCSVLSVNTLECVSMNNQVCKRV